MKTKFNDLRIFLNDFNTVVGYELFLKVLTLNSKTENSLDMCDLIWVT